MQKETSRKDVSIYGRRSLNKMLPPHLKTFFPDLLQLTLFMRNINEV